MHKFLAVGLVATFVAVSAQGRVICSGDSASVAVDSRNGVEPLVDSVDLPWNASWVGGDTNATVVIADNGTEVMRTTGMGVFAYVFTDTERHELTYTTFVDGVAQDEVYEAIFFKDWKYEVANGCAVIVATTQTSGDVVIPAEIDGYSVTEVGDGVFASCSNLTSVTIPQSVCSSQMSIVFPDAYQAITNVVIQEGVTVIGASAFEGCAALTSISIPNSVWGIGERAFANCSGLRRVVVPRGLKRRIESLDVFANCSPDLEIVYVSAEIRNVTAKQRYPWNGKVDITYEVVGDVTAGVPAWDVCMSVSATNRVAGTNYVADASALSGETGTAEGAHHVVWDLNQQGIEFKSDDLVFSVAYSTIPQYCVVDLSAGANVTRYSVTYMEDPPSGGFNTDEYKTTKLVLRLIEPGSFMMCGQYDVTLTRPFYCGLFEVTQRQYELVTGSNPSLYKGDMCPVERVSWNTIRGGSGTYDWPSSANVNPNSFVGRIQARTGLNFDLPTEAQWEYACRAGTTSSYNNGGDSEDDLKQLGRYSGNSSDGKGGYTHFTKVGSYLPNAWGLYDMHGNVWEWCLDWYGGLTSAVTDPKGSSSGSNRVLRGGCWNDSADFCPSSRRYSYFPWDADIFSSSIGVGSSGFRLVRTLSSIEGVQRAGASQDDSLYSGDSMSVAVDSRIGVEPLVDSVDLPWNASWVGGDTNATVVIADNGTEVMRTTGMGVFAYVFTDTERHELTYTTFVDGVAQDEVYEAIFFKDWKYEVANGCAVIVATTQTSGDVVIPAEIDGYSVTEVGDGVFASCSNLTSVTIPESVRSIGTDAFAGCSFDVSMSAESLAGLQENVFGECRLTVIVNGDGQYIPDCVATNVRKVVFADGVTQIPDNYFRIGESGHAGRVTLPNLETFDIAESVVRIGTNVFEACSALETVVTNGVVLYQGWCLGFDGHAGRVTLPEGVRGIAAGAFEGEYGIETVEFPSTLRFVGAGAFRDCTGVEGIALPECVVAVDREAFRNCTYAQELSLPDSLREIGVGAFANCSQLMGVTLPDGVLDVGEVAFSNCWRMLSASIPCSVTNVGAGAFAECRRLTGVTVPLGLATIADLFPAAYGKIESVVVVGGEDAAVAGRPPYQMVPRMFAGCGAMESLTLPEDLAAVSADAFAGCTNMMAFNLPDTVTNIGARAFKDLEQLTAFAFPTGLVVVGEEAFAGCTGFVALSLPEGLRKIDAGAFNGLSLLARVDIPGSVTNVGAAAFGGCAQVRAISLPGDAATVSAMFPDTYGLITSATVVDSTARSASAPYQMMPSLFEGCAALVGVEMPPSLTAIGARAFKGCSSLTVAGIPSGVTALGEEAFMGCANLSQMALPNGLGVLPSRAFANCSSLTEMTLPESVGELGADVFTGCGLLRSVRFVGNAPAYDASAYGGTDAALVTYVPNGSMGWDGVPTSRALPEFWPDGTTHEIAWWEPNRFLVDFVADDGAGVVTTQVEQVTGTTYILPADATRQGAAFGGWWTAAVGGARVTAVTQVALTRPHAFYAHWTFNRYSVVFDANGGEGTMNAQELTVATGATLPECGFMRIGYAFAGWATEPDGEVVYTNAAEVVDLAYEQGASVTLYAVWTARDWTLADYVDCGNLVFSNDAAAVWTPDSTTYKTGGVSLRSGSIDAAAEGGRTNTTLTATVVGAGSGSFWWKVNCEEMDDEYDEWYDYAVFTIDGVEVAKIAGDSGWRQVEYTVTGAGPHVLAWTFSRDDYDEDGATWQNCAWVDGVVWTPTPVTVTFAAGGATEGDVPPAVTKYAGYELTLPGPGTLANGAYMFMGWSDGEMTYASGTTYVFGLTNTTLTAVWGEKVWTLGEAVGADATSASLPWMTGGDADWSVDATTSWTNGVSAKSGTVTSGQTSWIEVTVNGAGTLEFRWNVMGGVYRNNPFAYAKVEVDGTQQAQEHKTEGWKEQAVAVTGTGTHTIRWTYLRTSTRAADGDCAWLDGVVWSPSAPAGIVVDAGGNKTVIVPTEWIVAHPALVTAAGGDAEAAVRNGTAANGRKVWECYVLGLDPEVANDFKITTFPMKADGTPDLANIAFTPPQAQWNVPGARPVVQGAAALDSEWQVVTEENKAGFRFFKVVVELP